MKRMKKKQMKWIYICLGICIVVLSVFCLCYTCGNQNKPEKDGQEEVEQFGETEETDFIGDSADQEVELPEDFFEDAQNSDDGAVDSNNDNTSKNNNNSSSANNSSGGNNSNGDGNNNDGNNNSNSAEKGDNDRKEEIDDNENSLGKPIVLPEIPIP